MLYHLSISQTHWQVSRPPRRQRAVVLTQLAPSDSAVRACAADSGHARHDDHRPVTGFTYGTDTTSPLIYESGKLTKVVSWCYKLPRRLARGQFSRSCGVLPVAEARIPSPQPATHCTGHLLRRVNFRTADQRHFTSKPIRDGRRDDVGWLRCHLRHYMEPTELAPGSRRRAQVQTFTSSDTLPGIKMPVTHHLLNTSRPRDTPPNLSPRYTKAVHALTAKPLQ